MSVSLFGAYFLFLNSLQSRPLTERKRQKDLEWSKKPVNCATDVTVGDLYEGPRASDVKPYTSDSQRLQWKLVKDWQEKQQKFQGINVGNR